MITATRPAVSCVIPAYEHFDQFSRCLVSLLAQDVDGLEVIVTDDSASDRIARFCAALEPLSANLRYIPGPRNGKPVMNWNQGLDQANGRYAIVVHQDEFLLDPTYLRRAVALLETTDEEAIFAQVTLISVNRSSGYQRARAIAARSGYRPWTLFAMNWVGPTAVVVFRHRPERRFDEQLVNLVDVEFYFRLLGPGGRPRFLDGLSVCSLAHHDGQISAAIDGRLLSFRELAAVAAKHPGLTRSQSHILGRVLRARIGARRVPAVVS